MTPVRLGAVSYLNARPLVFGLDRQPRFSLRYDVPSECARLLHVGLVDVGLIPSIEYLRSDNYRVVPDLAIASRGPVASVALFTTRPLADIRSVVLDTSSRTSIALLRVLCKYAFKISPPVDVVPPDLNRMLDRADAALLIGDNALYAESALAVEKIDLGEAWTNWTGLPFVWAFWTGRENVLTLDDARALIRARDEGIGQTDAIARDYFRPAGEAAEDDPPPDELVRRAIGARYLRDNIKYHLGDDERAAVEAFYRYAVEVGVIPSWRPLQFFAADAGTRGSSA